MLFADRIAFLFHVPWCCRTSFICIFYGELISTSWLSFQYLCNCVLVDFISFTRWALTCSKLVGDHFNQHMHARARGHTHTSILVLKQVDCNTSRFSKLLLFSFFFHKDGSDRLMKGASYSCCNFLCVVLAVAYLKYWSPVSLVVLAIRLALFLIVTHARACMHRSVSKLTFERLLLFCADRWNIGKLNTTMQHALANYTWKKKASQG